MDWFIIIGFILTIAFAFTAAEVEDRLLMIVFLFLTTLFLGLLFIYVGAVYAGIFHFLVYSGVLTVLFAATSYLVENRQVTSQVKTPMEAVVNEN